MAINVNGFIPGALQSFAGNTVQALHLPTHEVDNGMQAMVEQQNKEKQLGIMQQSADQVGQNNLADQAAKQQEIGIQQQNANTNEKLRTDQMAIAKTNAQVNARTKLDKESQDKRLNLGSIYYTQAQAIEENPNLKPEDKIAAHKQLQIDTAMAGMKQGIMSESEGKQFMAASPQQAVLSTAVDMKLMQAAQKKGAAGSNTTTITQADGTQIVVQGAEKKEQGDLQKQTQQLQQASDSLDAVAKNFEPKLFTIAGKAEATAGSYLGQSGLASEVAGAIVGPKSVADAKQAAVTHKAFEQSIDLAIFDIIKAQPGARFNDKSVATMKANILNAVKNGNSQEFEAQFDVLKDYLLHSGDLNKKALTQGINVTPGSNANQLNTASQTIHDKNQTANGVGAQTYQVTNPDGVVRTLTEDQVNAAAANNKMTKQEFLSHDWTKKGVK